MENTKEEEMYRLFQTNDSPTISDYLLQSSSSSSSLPSLLSPISPLNLHSSTVFQSPANALPSLVDQHQFQPMSLIESLRKMSLRDSTFADDFSLSVDTDSLTEEIWRFDMFCPTEEFPYPPDPCCSDSIEYGRRRRQHLRSSLSSRSSEWSISRPPNRFGSHIDRRCRWDDGTVLGSFDLGPPMRNCCRFPPSAVMHSCLDDVRGRVVNLAKDHRWSLFLQNMIDNGPKEAVDVLFLEAKDYFCELMMDASGNYFMQKLIEACNEEQRMEIVLALTKNEYDLINMCLKTHGTSAVQKLVDCISTQQQIALVVSALTPGTIILVNNIVGRQVIVRCLIRFSSEDTKCFFIAMTDHCLEVATDKNGGRVLQWCLSFLQGEQRDRLLGAIVAHGLYLAQDPFGNYVVQRVLQMKIPHVTTKLLRLFKGHYVSLSMQKCSSNVVQKCLKESGEAESRQIIIELLTTPNPLMLLQHAFANYVMQSALEVSKGPIRAIIVDLVLKHMPVLRNHLHGKKIAQKINS